MGLSLRRALDTPDAELEGVFGPEALQERDALIERIRVRLEAEGIELGDAFSGEASDDVRAKNSSESAEPSERASGRGDGRGRGRRQRRDEEPSCCSTRAGAAASGPAEGRGRSRRDRRSIFPRN